MSSSGFTILFIVLLSFGTVISCKKDVQPETPEELLTKTEWQVDELRYLKNNVLNYYKRGQEGNTVNYDNEYIKFDQNKKGMLYGTLSPTPITWAFANSDKTKIQFTVSFQGYTPFLVTWDNIILSENSIRYTEYYTQDGIKVLAEGTRTPR